MVIIFQRMLLLRQVEWRPRRRRVPTDRVNHSSQRQGSPSMNKFIPHL